MDMNTPLGILPILPLRNTVLFPGLTQVIKVGRPRSIHALKAAEEMGYWIVAVQQKSASHSSDEKDKEKQLEPQDVHDVGTLCRIDSMKGTPETGYQIVLQGMARRRLENIH